MISRRVYVSRPRPRFDFIVSRSLDATIRKVD